jgi:hypothetical protein
VAAEGRGTESKKNRQVVVVSKSLRIIGGLLPYPLNEMRSHWRVLSKEITLTALPKRNKSEDWEFGSTGSKSEVLNEKC